MVKCIYCKNEIPPGVSKCPYCFPVKGSESTNSGTRWGKSSEINHENAIDLYHKALSRYKRGYHDEALIIINKALDISPDYFDATKLKEEIVSKMRRQTAMVHSTSISRAQRKNQREKHSWKFRYLLIGIIIISIGITQFSLIQFNKTELIWEEYPFGSSGNANIYLPNAPNGYLLITEAYHGDSSDYTWIDITFIGSKTYTYQLTISSFTLKGWFRDGVVINIPSGQYTVSWSCSGACGSSYNIKLYKESFFNRGDIYLNSEKFTLLFSSIGLYLTIFFGAVLIITGIKNMRQSSKRDQMIRT